MDGTITFVALWALLIPAILVITVIIARRRWLYDIIEAALAALATIVLVKVAGAVIFEQRPFIAEHLRPLISHTADNSFPSDHLAACGLACAYLWPRSRPAAVSSLVVSAAVAAARVVARLHWPIDVASGFALGVLGTTLVQAASRIYASERAS